MLGLHLFEGGLTPIWRALHGEILLYLIIFITAIVYDNKKKNRVFQHTNYNRSIVATFAICYFPLLFTALLNLSIGAVFPFLLIIFYLQLRDDIKVRVFDVFIRVLAFTLLLSIIEYLICVTTSQYIVLFPSIPTDTGSKTFDQTLFNFIPIESVVSLGSFSFFKFQSLSDEPGNVGTICAFLLFATSDCKRYKYEYIIFWIAGVLSFSAAFYILAAIHLAFSLKRKNLGFLFVGAVLVFVLYHYFQEAFDLFIFNRFSGDNIDSLDNRSTAEFDAHLKAAFWDGSLWFGKGFGAKMDTGGHGGVAGLKAYLWIYGIIGTAAILWGYTMIYIKSLKRQAKIVKKYGLVFLFVFMLSFYQREYITYIDYVVIFFTMPFLLTYKGLVDNIAK
ncbi:MAG: hypothetical protein K5656_09115 [Lachnospiraceae bacterium]|nr:hypothetical protein [Lachnospiraceae bacterium]